MEDRFIVVGSTGRVGRMVSAAWKGDPNAVRRVVLQNRHRDARTNASSLHWDPLNGTAPLRDWVARYGPLRSMVVLAGVTPAQGRDLSLNTDIAIACLSAAMEAKIPRVLIASSAAVYGTGDGTPFAEAAECNPVNDYGWAKFAMENACRVMAGSDVEICCLRIGNVAGADALLLNVARMGPNNPVMIDTFADGRGPVRSYIGPKSLARVLSTIAIQEATLPPVLNIASPCAISMDALATAAEHPWHAQPAPANMPQSITLDISLLRQSCDFSSEESCASEMVLQWKEALSR